MSEGFNVLFCENKPIDPIWLQRFLNTFSAKYYEVVNKVIKESRSLEDNNYAYEIFVLNTTTLLPRAR